MTYNLKIHNRQSIRLKGYDYSQAGLYFITICVQNRLHLFGEIKNVEMILNDAGIMVEKWYIEMENKYPNIKCGVHVVMPNHFHCIVEIVTDAWPRFEKRLWQKRYWDHIIRDEKSYNNISNYIKNNPAHWDEDKFKL